MYMSLFTHKVIFLLKILYEEIVVNNNTPWKIEYVSQIKRLLSKELSAKVTIIGAT